MSNYVTLRVTEEERATIISALLNYSCYWGAKAGRGHEGRAACSLIEDEATRLYQKLSGFNLCLPIVVRDAPPPSPPKPTGPAGGVKVVTPRPLPVIPPVGAGGTFDF